MSETQFADLFARVEQLVDTQQTELALDLVDDALAHSPNHARLLYLKGFLHHQRHELPDACLALDACANLGGELSAIALYMLGNVQRDADNIEAACDCYNRALELQPTLTDAWINMGSLLDDVGQHDMALRCYDAALAIDANDAVAWYNRGNTLRELEQTSQAAASYAQAARLMPENFEAMLGLAVCRVQLQEAGALDDLRTIVSQTGSPLALFELATALTSSEQFSEALEYFQVLVEQGTTEPAVWNNRGECLAGLGRTDEALESYDRAIEVDPHFEAAFLGKTRLLIHISRTSEAKSVLDQLLSICSDEMRNSTTMRNLLHAV